MTIGHGLCPQTYKMYNVQCTNIHMSYYIVQYVANSNGLIKKNYNKYNCRYTIIKNVIILMIKVWSTYKYIYIGIFYTNIFFRYSLIYILTIVGNCNKKSILHVWSMRIIHFLCYHCYLYGINSIYWSLR